MLFRSGLGIDCFLDEHLKFKPKQVNIILGHDNVGKTYWINWYFLTLALKHELTFCIWSGENDKWQIMRNLIQMYSGIQFKDLEEDQIVKYATYLEQYFKFIDNSKMYKSKELLKLFEESECKVGLIDPFTGLDREMSYSGNYDFMNEVREFVNFTGMTIYINTHPNTESGRGSNIYTDGQWKGNLKAPLKDHVEGGKAFSNRCDDFLVIHRLVKDPEMKYNTWVNIEKVKDMETGGKHTNLNDPVVFNFNYGIGFMVNGVDPLKPFRPKISNQFPKEIKSIIDTNGQSSFDLTNVIEVNGKELISTSEKFRRMNNETPF